jgi:hypothetical protein
MDKLNLVVKCRITFQDYHENLAKNHMRLNHHWIIGKQEEDFIDNKCFQCMKNLSTRVFSLPTTSNRFILMCTWCKKVLHLKCFINGEHNLAECILNDFIIPPNWINKVKRRSLKSKENTSEVSSDICKRTIRSFIVRQSTEQQNLITKPIIVLINPKSGGNLGAKLVRKFMWLLNPRQVFDLNQFGSPKFA